MAEGQLVHSRSRQVVRHVVPRRTVIRLAVVVVLKRPAVAVHVQPVVTQTVRHRLAPGVVHRKLQAAAHALTQRRLQPVEVHLRPRLRDHQDLRSHRRAQVLVVVVQRRGRIPVHKILVQVAVVLDVLPRLAHVPRLHRRRAGDRVLRGQVPLLHIRRLLVLRIHLRHRPARRSRESLLHCPRSPAARRTRARRRRDCVDGHRLNERRLRRQPLVRRVALLETRRPIAGAHHQPLRCLIRESHTWHELPEVRLVTGRIAAHPRTRRRAHRHFARVQHLPGRNIDVCRPVKLLDPRLDVLIPQPQVQRQVGTKLVVVPDVPRRPPLPLSHAHAAQGGRHLSHPVQHKVRARPAQPIGLRRIAGERARIVHRSQKSKVVAGRVIVLVPDSLDAHAQQMAPTLPRQILDIAVRVVDHAAVEPRRPEVRQIARAAAPAERRVRAEPLIGETHERLRSKRNPHLRVARVAELPCRVPRRPLVPVHPRKADPRRVHNLRRENMHPVRPHDIRRIYVDPRKRNRQHGRLSVISRRGRKERRHLIRPSRVPLDLHIALVVGLVLPRRPLQVVSHQPVSRRRVRLRIKLRMRQKKLQNRIQNRNSLVTRIRSKVVLRVVQLNRWRRVEQCRKIPVPHRRRQHARRPQPALVPPRAQIIHEEKQLVPQNRPAQRSPKLRL